MEEKKKRGRPKNKAETPKGPVIKRSGRTAFKDMPAKAEALADYTALGEKICSVLGRPSSFTPEIADMICTLVATHPASLEQLHEEYLEWGFPTAATVWGWMHKFPDFFDNYRRAKQLQAQIFANQLAQIAYNPDCDPYVMARDKIKIDAIKWVASKFAPKWFGDSAKIEEAVTSEALDNLQVQLDSLRVKHEKEY